MSVDDLRTDFRISVLTWNVKSSQPSESLNALFAIDDSECNVDRLPDAYAVGFQELTVNPLSLLLEEPWVVAIIEALSKWGFIKLKHIRLQGILLVLFCKKQHLMNIRDIETSYIRTGLGGYWGNKGAVAIRFSVYGCSVCIVNSHLAAHDNQLQQRINDYNAIIDGLEFTNSTTSRVLFHDYIIWFGDLNFRLEELSGNEIHEIILKAKSAESSKLRQSFIDELLSKDQLSIVRHEGRAFSELDESKLTFLPTYRFKAKTDEYDFKSRRPAFTDRVLYRINGNVYDNIKLELKQFEYLSHTQYKQSDHKPVTSSFSIKVLTSRAMAILNLERGVQVTFHPTQNWHIGKDSVAWYKIEPQSDEVDSRVIENLLRYISEWDWIGLFKANFSSLDDYICYTWASRYPHESGPPTVTDSDQESSQIDGASVSRHDTRGPWFKVIFSEQVLLIQNTYRLLYIDHKGNVLGMSSPFLLSV
ncbi:Inositol polyphosphate 5-phosphatase K-like protein [Dinothrombium tinctorium]|uniref:Inositol polyphosphate 5-phosphatase K-like protein n=1 Tax=Dinothrombium tinctorium TaxID=1965070 RepID=A0A3S3P2R4_9ACAR|nr:Inositol polyphosphate 5-phosphatase K-like protein [Dinothrombium tinctorium]RWS11534.1 Inositol polyphosphate 5-phosphatase K-like protein [Dinothrombium tinctorium]RWS15808.1 Inositol polyphosphate 5-phosphatase K-like protein [Dinothrombium tinctorium]